MNRLVRLGGNDGPALAEVHAAAFPRPWTADDLGQLIAGFGAAVLGIEADGRLAGFILFQAVAGEAEILTLAVRPDMRRQGLGSGLVEAAALAANRAGAEILWLEVAADNTAALALYGATGFSEAGRRPGYYQSESVGRIDALLMRRALNTSDDSD